METISKKSAFASPLLITALLITSAIAIWGLVDTGGLADRAAQLVHIQFVSRSWFIMLAVSFMLIVSIWLALSRYGGIRLGMDDDEPEFSTISWLTMLFAAGTRGSPGIVMIAPHTITTNSAPAARRTSRIGTT